MRDELLLLGDDLLAEAEALRLLGLVSGLDALGMLLAVLILGFGDLVVAICRLAMGTRAPLLHLKLELLLLLIGTLGSLRNLLLALYAGAFGLLEVHVVFLEEL